MTLLEQLFEEEQLLLEQFAEESHLGWGRLVTFYERLFVVAKRARADAQTLHYCHTKLLVAYVDYGTYLKNGQEKSEKLAVRYLQKALVLDAKHAVANYRLGFLAYKQRASAQALGYFQTAIQGVLSEQQRLYAHMYMTNSALLIVEEAKGYIESTSTIAAPIPYEMSKLYPLIIENDAFLAAQAFCHFTREEVVMCSKEVAEEIIDTPPSNTLLVYFGDRQTTAIFNGQEQALELDSARILVDMLMTCSELRPGTRHTFQSYFQLFGKDGQVSPATYRKRISRLRVALAAIGLQDVILTKRIANETGYYVIDTLPFRIICRSDSYEAASYV